MIDASELDMVLKALNCFSVAGGEFPDCPCVFRDGENSCERNVVRKAQELLRLQANDIHHMGLIIEEYKKELLQERIAYNERRKND